MSASFHQILGLWITPDFSPVERGERAPPYVNFDTVDAQDIANTLSAFNRCGETVKVRVPDDAIDQVTIHLRMLGKREGSPQCEDFAAELLTVVRGASPLKVRAKWADLHALPDRQHAPPPVLLMFAVSGGFEAVMLWSQQLMMRMGIRAADPMKLMSGDVQDSDHEGRLPTELAQYFERVFGLPYRRECLVAKLASSPLPSWAGRP